MLNIGRAWKVGNGQTILASSSKRAHGLTPILRDEVQLVEAARLRVADLRDPTTNEWMFTNSTSFLFFPA